MTTYAETIFVCPITLVMVFWRIARTVKLHGCIWSSGVFCQKDSAKIVTPVLIVNQRIFIFVRSTLKFVFTCFTLAVSAKTVIKITKNHENLQAKCHKKSSFWDHQMSSKMFQKTWWHFTTYEYLWWHLMIFGYIFFFMTYHECSWHVTNYFREVTFTGILYVKP